jgi:hypothetical protein
MNRDFKIDPAGVRSCASGLRETGVRVAGAQAPLPAAGPHWAGSDAVETTGAAAQRRVRRAGDEIEDAARQILAAVLDYEDADDRAAARLRGAR